MRKTIRSDKALIHKFKLKEEPFRLIESGKKTIELRLYDEKRQRVKVGDTIVFALDTNPALTLTATVVKLHRFDSFESLYKALPLDLCGYTEENIASAHHSDMDKYYSREEQAAFGVVGIEIKLRKRNMDKKGIYVFDLDGTLVNSMPYFKRAMLSIADDEGIGYDDELIKILTPLGYVGGAKYYIEKYGVDATVEELCEKVRSRLSREYTYNIKLKDGVKEYIRDLAGSGCRLFVLTASPHSVTDVCLANNGVFGLFESIWSVEDFSLTKSDTRIFYEVAKTIGCEPSEIHYFDDSLIALENARAAGYITYGVYDSQTDDEVIRMRDELSDTLVMSFTELNK